MLADVTNKLSGRRSRWAADKSQCVHLFTNTNSQDASPSAASLQHGLHRYTPLKGQHDSTISVTFHPEDDLLSTTPSHAAVLLTDVWHSCQVLCTCPHVTLITRLQAWSLHALLVLTQACICCWCIELHRSLQMMCRRKRQHSGAIIGVSCSVSCSTWIQQRCQTSGRQHCRALAEWLRPRPAHSKAGT